MIFIPNIPFAFTSGSFTVVYPAVDCATPFTHSIFVALTVNVATWPFESLKVADRNVTSLMDDTDWSSVLKFRKVLVGTLTLFITM